MSCIESWLIDLNSKKLTKDTDTATAISLDFLERSNPGRKIYKIKSIKKKHITAISAKGISTRYNGISLGLVNAMKANNVDRAIRITNIFLLSFIANDYILKKSSGLMSSFLMILCRGRQNRPLILLYSAYRPFDFD